MIMPKSGAALAALGLGTYRLGEARASEATEVAALRRALEIGYRLFDTAEMYGDGGAERVLGRAIAQAVRDGLVARDELVVVSKVYPHNASRAGLLKACDGSRTRLALDRIDVYLLHWRGDHPLEHTIEAFETLCSRGAIGHWGVSNFDVDDLQDLWRAERATPDTTRCATNQVYYSLGTRGTEFALQPLMRRIGMPLMAYTPIDHGALGRTPLLRDLARERGVSATQIALAWMLSRQGVISIPKAARLEHLQQNWAAGALRLNDSELARIDASFPPPRTKEALAMV